MKTPEEFINEFVDTKFPVVIPFVDPVNIQRYDLQKGTLMEMLEGYAKLVQEEQIKICAKTFISYNERTLNELTGQVEICKRVIE